MKTTIIVYQVIDDFTYDVVKHEVDVEAIHYRDPECSHVLIEGMHSDEYFTLFSDAKKRALEHITSTMTTLKFHKKYINSLKKSNVKENIYGY